MKLIKQLLNRMRDPKSRLQTASLVSLVAFIYLLRSGQYLFKAQLFVEDGVLWLAEGYNKGLTAIFLPEGGFFHITERFFGFVVAHLPLQYAPLLFSISGWGLFILLAYYLISPRTKILANNYERVFMALALGLIANIEVFFFSLSNSIFLLGIIGILIMVAQPAKNLWAQVSEKIVFGLSCLTLPFVWFYLPVALFQRLKYKQNNKFFLYASLFGGVSQLACYLAIKVSRSPITIQSLFSKFTLLEIHNQIIIPALRFTRIDTTLLDFSTSRYPVLVVFLVITLMMLLTALVLKKGSRQLRYLLFFLAAMTFASLKSPSVTAATPIDAIKHMAVTISAGRYFVYGIIFINIVLIKSTYRLLLPNTRYAFMAMFIGLGLITALHTKVFFIDRHFIDYRSQYRQAIEMLESKQTDNVSIPVNMDTTEPQTTWQMVLSNKR